MPHPAAADNVKPGREPELRRCDRSSPRRKAACATHRGFIHLPGSAPRMAGHFDRDDLRITDGAIARARFIKFRRWLPERCKGGLRPGEHLNSRALDQGSRDKHPRHRYRPADPHRRFVLNYRSTKDLSNVKPQTGTYAVLRYGDKRFIHFAHHEAHFAVVESWAVRERCKPTLRGRE